MGHYECRHCGTYGCLGECLEESTEDSSAEIKTALDIVNRENRRVLQLRHEKSERRKQLEKALALLDKHKVRYYLETEDNSG